MKEVYQCFTWVELSELAILLLVTYMDRFMSLHQTDLVKKRQQQDRTL
jgi:hypothetical protein